MRRVYVASPLRPLPIRAGDTHCPDCGWRFDENDKNVPHAGRRSCGRLNLDYARECLLDSLRRSNEAPFAPHLLYPQVLDDGNPEDRARGMASAITWLHQANALALYVDLGVSEGMASEAREAMRRMPIWVRSIRTPAAVDLGEIVTEEDLGYLIARLRA